MITGYTSVTEDAYLTAHWISKKMWHHFQILTLLCNKRERRSVGRSSVTGQYISVKKSVSQCHVMLGCKYFFQDTAFDCFWHSPEWNWEIRLSAIFFPGGEEALASFWCSTQLWDWCEMQAHHLKLNKSKRPTDISHPCVTAIHILFYKIM